MREPQAVWMLVVMLSAWPCASTMLIWLVPDSACAGCGASARRGSAGTPAGTTSMARTPISAARCCR